MTLFLFPVIIKLPRFFVEIKPEDTAQMKKQEIQILTGKERGLVSIGKAAELLGVSIETLRNWEDNGTLLPFKTPAGTRKYRLNDLKKFQNVHPKLSKKLSPQPFHPYSNYIKPVNLQALDELNSTQLNSTQLNSTQLN